MRCIFLNSISIRSDENGRKIASLTIPFNTCGLSRVRSLNPKGIFITAVVIVTFHPKFLTKVDRAYKVQCFYMEADKVRFSRIIFESLEKFIQLKKHCDVLKREHFGSWRLHHICHHPVS